MAPQSPERQQAGVVDETTPLIASERAGPTPLQSSGEEVVVAKQVEAREAALPVQDDDEDKPLPKLQLLVLCYARTVEPVAFFSIFPFVSEMIKVTGSVPETDVGFYSGLVESLFSLTQMCTMMLWGRLSDRFGRRPILIVSTLGTATGMTLFGFSTSIWQMILFRCLGGVFSGSLVTIRTMFGEISTKKTQATAFSYFSFSMNVGVLVGPLLGGALAQPVKQYPEVFGGNSLFSKHPFALPTLATGAIALSSVLLDVLFLKETLGTKGKGPIGKQMSTREILRAPGVGWVLFLINYSSLIALAWTAIAPVFWFTRPSLGGYGLSPPQISLLQALGGAGQTIFSLFVFPPWQRRVGTGYTLRFCYAYYPLTQLANPLTSMIRRSGNDVAFWTSAVLTAIAGSSIGMTLTANQLALNDISPSPQSLGTLNALALTVTSAIRAVGPATFSSLFAFGVRNKILSGYFVWVIMIVMSSSLNFLIRYLPEKAAGGPVVVKKTSPEREAEEQR